MRSEVIQKYFDNCLEIMEDQGHRPLKCSSGVFKAERHFLICKRSPRTIKCHLMLVLRFNLYLIISEKSVHKGEHLATYTLIQNMIYKWCREVFPSRVTNSITERNSYGLGYHNRQLDSRNQSFPICNRN